MCDITENATLLSPDRFLRDVDKAPELALSAVLDDGRALIAADAVVVDKLIARVRSGRACRRQAILAALAGSHSELPVYRVLWAMHQPALGEQVRDDIRSALRDAAADPEWLQRIDDEVLRDLGDQIDPWPNE